MKYKNIYKKWEEFINDEKYKKYIQLPTMVEYFTNNLNKLKEYIDTNKKTPNSSSNDKNNKILNNWTLTNQHNYLKKQKNMKDNNICKIWENFINDEQYKEYFYSQYDYFIFNLNKVKIYIDTNKMRPPGKSTDQTINILCNFIHRSQRNYFKKQQNMKDDNIFKKWKEFINDDKYKEYFQSMDDIFTNNLIKLKIYIDTNKKRPSSDNKFLKQWISHQKHNYLYKIANMKDENIRKKWEEFLNDEKYKKYF